MQLEKEECENASLVLEETKKALQQKNSLELRDLSNRTLHSSCFYQNPGSITTAVIIYALSKLIERQDFTRIKFWEKFVKKFNALLDLSILSLKESNHAQYEIYIQKARSSLESVSPDLKPYIIEVLRKAAINKGSKIYEHGISMEQTANLLGVTQWELASYAGQKNIPDIPQNESIPVQQRAKTALEFFE